MSRKNKNKPLLLLIGIMLVALVGLIVLALNMGERLPKTPAEAANPTTAPTEPTPEPTTEPTTEPTEPPIVKEATATIGATGDILMHDLVIQSGYNSADGSYDYNYIFEYYNSCVSGVDFAVANLEVTLCSNTNGYKYQGYPCFNSPDTIVQALKNAGFDLLLTANNHSYDTGAKGFARTQQIVQEHGLPHIGSRPTQDADPYYIANVNGISIGMINYTYNTGTQANGAVALNGIPLSVENSGLINTFSYDRLDSFYSTLSSQIQAMRQDGAEAIVLYIHWGDEYQTKENATQRKMSQQLCNLGIDVIVGNHAHVPQPVKLLTNENDSSRKTLCLYSTGNAVSNIYRNNKFSAHTEDGMLFTFTFAKYSDGTVLVESARVIPTWVHRYDEGNVRKFQVLYMDDTQSDWQTLMDLDDKTLGLCQESYDRTMAIVGAGIEEANSYYAENQQAVEASLGIE